MPHANNVTVADGSATQFTIPFNYLERDHVTVYIDNVATTDQASLYTASFVDDSVIEVVSIQDASPVEAGKKIKILRTTPIQDPQVVFQDGAAILSDDLNATTTQVLFAAQEMADRDTNRLSADHAGNFDLNGARLTGVLTPVDDTDAISKSYLDGTVSGLRSDYNQTITKAQEAETSATSAGASARQAATHAANVEALFQGFSDRYLGAFDSDPVPAGDAPPFVDGQLYHNSVTNTMKVYADGSFVDAITAPQAWVRDYFFEASDLQTTFSGADREGNVFGYESASVIVTINGIRMSNRDYTLSGNDTLTFSVACEAGDIVQVTSFSSFVAADVVTASAGGSYEGHVSFAQGISLGHGWSVVGTADRLEFRFNGVAKGALKPDGALALGATASPLLGLVPLSA